MTAARGAAGVAVSQKVVIDAPVGATRVVYHSGTRKYFKLGLREAAFLEALDGGADQAALSAANAGGFNPAEVAYLLDWFASQGLTGDELMPEPPVALPARLLRLLTGATPWRIHLVDPDRFLQRHLTLVHACFSRAAMLLYLLIFLFPAGLFILWPERMSLPGGDLTLTFTPWHWLGMYLAMLVMIAVHELAHAVACKHFGGEVRRIGLMLMYLQPVVYCDVSASWRFKTVEAKLVVAAAGIFVQLLVSCLALSAWALGGGVSLAYFAGINAGVAMLNFFPLIKLDGYWMLVHLLDEPNLGRNSLQAVGDALRGMLDRGAAPRKRFHAGLFSFGVARIAAMAVFWGLGLYTIHRYAASLSAGLAAAVTAVAAFFLLYRAVLVVRGYLRMCK